jgi:hypothetical protein
MKEWGGLDGDEILHDLKKEDISDIGAVMAKVEEALTEKQARDQKYQDELKMLQKANDTGGVKKLTEAEEARKAKRLEVVKEKTVAFFTEEKTADKKSTDKKPEETALDVSLPVFDEYTNDEEWWKEFQAVVKSKISVKQSGEDGEKAAKQKNDEEMTKLLCNVSQAFDAEKLPFEHARAIDHMLVALRKSCLLGLIRKGDYKVVLPSLMATESTQSSFSKYLRIQFNAAVIEWLQVG